MAYGIGALAVILANESLWRRVEAAGIARCVGILLLVGVALQVGLAALNKAIMWVLYYGEDDEPYQLTRPYKWADSLAKAFWIDLGCDLVSMALFSYATYRLFTAVA